MDIGDILRIFGFLLIPIIFKAFKESKNVKNKEATTNTNETYHSKRITKEPELTMTDDHSALAPNVKPNREIKRKPNAREGFLESTSSLKPIDKKLNERRNGNKKSVGYNEYDIKDTIINSEIGSNELNLRFNKSELVRGIVMSEVLSKPKSLRK